MHIAILTFQGFNELDSLIALGILNRVKRPDWRVSIASPAAPPANASTALSVRSCRMIRTRPAPIASRVATSFRRAAARARSKPATFAQAINNTMPTAVSGM